MTQPRDSHASSLPPSLVGVQADASATPAYHVDRLRFGYPPADPDRVTDRAWVFNGLTFEVKRGEVLGLIGPNGSGKSTLLKLLVKIYAPQGGRVRLFDQALDRLAQETVAQLAAYVPQETHQPFPFTVAETVMMGRFPHRPRTGRILGITWDQAADVRLVHQTMNELDVAHLAHRSIGEISGGERQRVLIARSLVQQPRVLLLDEPTAFLDLHHQLEICRILRRLNQAQGLTVIVVSHDLNLASQYCDRLLLLNDGAIAALGTPEDVIRGDLLKAVYRCGILVDRHPGSGRPRITLPGRDE